MSAWPARLLPVVLALALPARGEEFYFKRVTREATRQASLALLKQKLGVVEFPQSPWRFVGPFPSPDGKGATTVYPPEERVDLGAEYDGLGGRKIHWQDGNRFTDGEINELSVFPVNEFVVCYLHRTIESDQDQDVHIYLGSNDSITAWLNGAKIHEFNGGRAIKLDEDHVTIHLKKGTNAVLLKVGNLGGSYEFSYKLSRFSPVEQGRIDEATTRLNEQLGRDFPTGEARYYRIDTVAVPHDIILEVGGMALMPDGRLMVCTRRGEVWSLLDDRWKLFASGLDEPMGVCPTAANQIIVAQRPELTRLTDTDGDGEADQFETLADQWNYSGHIYEWTFGPVRDRAGNLYGTLACWFFPTKKYDLAPYSGWEIPPPHGYQPGCSTAWRGWCFQVTPRGEFIPWSAGLRSPNGLGISPAGDLFVSDNQGEYYGACVLHHITRDAFHGHPNALFWGPTATADPFGIPMAELDQRRKLPAVVFPYGVMGQSASQPLWDETGGKFGPFARQMFIGDQTKATVMRVQLEKVEGEFQGACFPFRAGFQSGNNCLVFDRDGSLLVGQTDRGWGAIGGKPYGLQRLVWTGDVPFEIHSMQVTHDGFELLFTEPVDAATARNPDTYSLQHYHYYYQRKYGSPQVANTSVKAIAVEVSADRRRVKLKLPELVPGKIYELHVRGLRSEDGSELLHDAAYYTLNRIPKP